MIITNEKIEVTITMMQKANMTRGSQFGVPVDIKNLSLGLRWKDIFELTTDDFDKIEDYFLNLKT